MFGGENFPYTNFHDLNMDWIIKIAKDFLDQYTHLQETIAGGETQLSAEITEGLAQLQTKADALEALLNQWYETHSNDIAAELSQAIINFNQAAEQKGIDVTASIPSDYSELSRIANTTRENLLRYNASNLFNMQKNYSFNGTYYGVTIVYDPIEDCFTLNGTSNAAGNVNLLQQADALPEGLVAGQPYIFRAIRNNMNIQADVFAYVNGSWASDIVITSAASQAQKILPADAVGMLIRIRIPDATTFTNEKIHIELYKDFVATYNGITANVAIANNAVRDPDVIEYYLAKNPRICILEAGKHIINRTLKMGYGSWLLGVNFNTSILTQTENTFDLIHIENVARTRIDNIHLQGLVVNIGVSPVGYGCGIRVIGDDSADYPRFNIIEHCQIHGFQGGGIVLENNSYWVANSVTVHDCEIWRNYAGIWTKPKAEYNRISDCLFYSNYIGILNNGGNNTFINCDITENRVGFYIDANATVNDGHGSLIGCTINHSDSNNGYAFILRDVDNGFLIDGCNIWYGKIIISGSTGVMFSDCLIGRAASPDIQTDDNVGIILFNNCLFKEAPTITGTTAPTMQNCHTYAGASV